MVAYTGIPATLNVEINGTLHLLGNSSCGNKEIIMEWIAEKLKFPSPNINNEILPLFLHHSPTQLLWLPKFCLLLRACLYFKMRFSIIAAAGISMLVGKATAFNVTEEFMHALLDPAATGNTTLFGETLDPAVRWWIANDVKSDITLTGIRVSHSIRKLRLPPQCWHCFQNASEWNTEVNTPLIEHLTSPPNTTVEYMYVFPERNVAIMEATGHAIRKFNGKPYSNRYVLTKCHSTRCLTLSRFCWHFFFSYETGKIVEIHEYLDTNMVRELMTEGTKRQYWSETHVGRKGRMWLER